jgi:hypothetical protein
MYLWDDRGARKARSSATCVPMARLRSELELHTKEIKGDFEYRIDPPGGFVVHNSARVTLNQTDPDKKLRNSSPGRSSGPEELASYATIIRG